MNNIKQTETAAFDVLFVKIPKEAIDLNVLPSNILLYDNKNGQTLTIKINIAGDWQLLTDDLANITEKQAAIVCPKQIIGPDNWEGFVNYSPTSKVYAASSAIDSLQGIAESVQAYIKNPMGEKPKRVGKWVEKEGIDTDYREFVYSKKFKEWRQAEANTGRWAVLYKPKNK